MNNGVKAMIKDMEDASFMDKADNGVRFTVTLSERDNRRLEYLSRRYGMKRAEMSRQLLIAAMVDAEDVLELAVIEDKNSNGKFEHTDYYKYISGQISLDECFKGQAQGGDE